MNVEQKSILDVKSEVVYAYELVQLVATGRVRIPRFQRKFVWRREQMRDLLDSICRKYPIGSILVWDTDGRFDSFDWVGPVPVPGVTSAGSTYVLDGEQRLSTLTGVLLHRESFHDSYEGDRDQWIVFYDLKDQEFIHIEPSKRVPQHFPMWKLLDTFEFLDECRRLVNECGDDAQDYIRRAETLSQIFKSYKLPVIRVQNAELTEAVEIFARLNTKGQQMTPDEIVSALAYRERSDEGAESFILSKAIDELIEVLEEHSFGGIARVMVLRVLLAALREDIYRTDWTRIFRDRDDLREPLPDAVSASRDSLRHAVGFLKEIGVHSDRLLPYALQLVVLSEFFRNCPDPSDAQRALLTRWFWVSSFTGWFGGGNPSRTTRLIEEFRSVALDPEAQALQEMRLDEPAQALPLAFDLRSARIRAHALVMLSLEPRMPDGSARADAWRLLDTAGPRAFGYIFRHPKAMNERERDLRSSPANRILNLTKDRGQAKKWLQGIDPSVQRDVAESYGMSAQALEALDVNNPERFLEERFSRLVEIERQFMEARGVTPPIERESRSAAIDTGDDD